MAAGVAYGIVLEFYQDGLIPGRICSPADALADAVGIALRSSRQPFSTVGEGDGPVRAPVRPEPPITKRGR